MASSATPWRASAASAPASRRSVTLWLKRASATPMRSPSPLGVACRWRGTGWGRSAGALEPGEKVSELGLLGAEVLDVARVRRHLERCARHHVHAVALESPDLLRVVGEEPYPVHAQGAQDLRPDAVFAQVLPLA